MNNYNEKIKEFIDSHRLQDINILIIADGDIPSVHLMIIQPLNLLKIIYSLTYDITYGKTVLTENIDLTHYNLVIFVRILSSDIYTEIAQDCVVKKIPIIYALDDDFSSIDRGLPSDQFILNLNPDEMIKKFCKIASIGLFSSESLYNKYKEFCNEAIFTNNFVDLNYIESLNIQKDYNKDNLVIGYASTDHNYYNLKIMIEPLREILINYPNVTFECFFTTKPKELEDLPNVVLLPIINNIYEFYKFVAERDWDIGIAPLSDNEFNKAKSNNKYREYAALKIPGIYSNVSAYDFIISNIGLQCFNTPKSWYNALEALILSPSKRGGIATVAYGHLSVLYNPDKIIEEYREIIFKHIKRRRVLILGNENLTTIQIAIVRPFLILKEANIIEYDIVNYNYFTMDILKEYTYLIIVRAIEINALEIMKYAKQLGLKVIYCWDDNLLKIEPVDYFSQLCNNPNVRRNIQEILETAHLVKCSTESLKKESLLYNPNSIFKHYTFDFSLLPIIPEKNKPEGRIRVGYFGTPGRDNQFYWVMSALIQIAKKYQQVDFEFIGYIPVNLQSLIKVIKETNSPSFIYTKALTPFYNEAITSLTNRDWDIGLAPLLDNEFNKSKSLTKYRDYGVTGSAGIYTNIETYNKYIVNNETGLLVDNTTEAWFNAIESLIINTELRNNIIKNSYKDIEENYNVVVACKDWCGILKTL